VQLHPPVVRQSRREHPIVLVQFGLGPDPAQDCGASTANAMVDTAANLLSRPTSVTST
jgi:hypothetical protein